jgi:hypothetical protein
MQGIRFECHQYLEEEYYTIYSPCASSIDKSSHLYAVPSTNCMFCYIGFCCICLLLCCVFALSTSEDVRMPPYNFVGLLRYLILLSLQTRMRRLDL